MLVILNKNIHFNLTIFLFSSWLTVLLGMFLLQNRVSLAHEQIYKNNILKVNNSSTDKSLTPSVVEQKISKEKLELKEELGKINDDSEVLLNTPKSKNKPKTVSKSDFYPSEKETLTQSKIITKTVTKSNPELVLTKTLDLIREFEGFRAHAYRDTDGTPVIGYGLSQVGGRKVQMGDRISIHQAEAALKAEVHAMQEQIKSIVTVELDSHQLGALTSFAFNTGFYNLKRSTLLRKLNAGDRHGAANEFLRWNKAHSGGRLVPMAGLTRRRQAERQLFLTYPAL